MKLKPYYKKAALILWMLIVVQVPLTVMAAPPWEKPVHLQERQLSDVLEEMGERYHVFFNYNSNLVQNIKVQFEFKQGEQLQQAVDRLLSSTGLAYEHFSDKYIVIYRDNKKGRKRARKIQKRIRQINDLENQGDLFISRSSQHPLSRAMNIVRGAEVLMVEKSIEGTVTDEEGLPLT